MHWKWVLFNFITLREHGSRNAAYIVLINQENLQIVQHEITAVSLQFVVKFYLYKRMPADNR